MPGYEDPHKDKWWKKENPIDVMAIVATWLENFANGDEYERNTDTDVLLSAQEDAKDLAARLNKAIATVEGYSDREEH